MQVVKDKFDNEVSIGDALIHIVKKSTDVEIHYSIVYGFIWRGGEYTSIKVASAKKKWSGNLYYYRATLTSDNFVKIPLESIAMNIREKLIQLICCL